MNLLICDDEQAILEGMVAMTTEFKACPLAVFSTMSSEEAVRVIQTESLDAVIFDIDIDDSTSRIIPGSLGKISIGGSEPLDKILTIGIFENC